MPVAPFTRCLNRHVVRTPDCLSRTPFLHCAHARLTGQTLLLFQPALLPSMLLYTEMATTGAIIHGKGDYLAYSEEEHPVALQLGGSDRLRWRMCETG